jgi:hypothetical protein
MFTYLQAKIEPEKTPTPEPQAPTEDELAAREPSPAVEEKMQEEEKKEEIQVAEKSVVRILALFWILHTAVLSFCCILSGPIELSCASCTRKYGHPQFFYRNWRNFF